MCIYLHIHTLHTVIIDKLCIFVWLQFYWYPILNDTIDAIWMLCIKQREKWEVLIPNRFCESKSTSSENVNMHQNYRRKLSHVYANVYKVYYTMTARYQLEQQSHYVRLSAHSKISDAMLWYWREYTDMDNLPMQCCVNCYILKSQFSYPSIWYLYDNKTMHQIQFPILLYTLYICVCCGWINGMAM